jgi:hypothetical protein
MLFPIQSWPGDVHVTPPATEQAIISASHTWRVPVNLVSAIIVTQAKGMSSDITPSNIEDVAKRLAFAWNRAPSIGNGILEDGISIYECWYFAIGRAGVGKDGTEANRYADKVLDVLALGTHPLKTAISITRLRPDQLSWGRSVFLVPAPWHFTGIERRPNGKTVVNISMPGMQQVRDAPDAFDGSGSCGPMSFVMLLAGLGKISEQPLFITHSYHHVSPYAGMLKEFDDRITEPEFGTVHFKMRTFVRSFFPTAEHGLWRESDQTTCYGRAESRQACDSWNAYYSGRTLSSRTGIYIRWAYHCQ